MEDCHLREHTVAGLLNHDAARSVKYFVGHDDAAPYGQAVHEPAIILRGLKPRLIDAPCVVIG